MAASTRITIDRAAFPADAALVRTLFEEYVAGLGIDLSFQDIGPELERLPGRYAAPGGTVLLARQADGETVGVAAMRPLTGTTAEMKRLYVRPAARGQRLGERLARAIVEAARSAGYCRIVLDTLPTMTAAHGLYEALGFVPIAAYYDNPVEGTRYLGLDL